MLQVDVIVLGSGISGCIAAALLAKKGYSVYIVSPTKMTENHLPESWIVDFPQFIDEWKIKDTLEKSFSYYNQCTFLSADGANELKVTLNSKKENKFSTGSLVSINRDSFDNVLLHHAIQSGAKLINFKQITYFQLQSKNEVRVTIQNDDSQYDLEASFLIDASGKSSFITNKLNLPIFETKLDKRLACFSHFSLPNKNFDGMQIISIEEGYIFCVPTFSGRLSIGCVLEEFTEVENAKQVFMRGVEQSSYIKEIIENSKQFLPIIPIKNIQRVCLNPCSSQFSIIGDAAYFMDPFYSSGIDFAFLSAFNAVIAFEKNDPKYYESFINEWRTSVSQDVYKKLEKSQWKSMIRLFSDPHQPYIIPILMTQVLGKIVRTPLSLQEGITLARESYGSCIY